MIFLCGCSAFNPPVDTAANSAQNEAAVPDSQTAEALPPVQDDTSKQTEEPVKDTNAEADDSTTESSENNPDADISAANDASTEASDSSTGVDISEYRIVKKRL